MKSVKKTLTIAWILCILACVFAVYNVVDVVRANEGKLYLFYAIFQLCLSVATTIIYFVYSLKKETDILKNIKMFYTICFINIFNNIICWAITFWVEIVMGRTIARVRMRTFNQPIKEDEKLDNNVFDIKQEDYQIKETADVLSKKLEELDTKLKNNEISLEEYEKLKTEAINKYMN